MKTALLLAALAVPAGTEAYPRGQVVERVATRGDATQSYALYLPPSWDPAGRHPVLLVMDPRGRALAAAEIFRPAAERHGWVLLSSWDTRSDGLGDNDKALRALWPEIGRWAPDTRRLYAAGFSGGGILTLVLGLSTKALAGVVDVGGRLPDELKLDAATFAHFGAAGRADFNALPMKLVDRALARSGVPRRLDFFDGSHQWFSAEHASRAITWLEVLAMQKELRPRDAAVVDAAWREELAAGAALHAAGRVGEALAHDEMLIRSFAGLRAVDEAAARLATVRADPRTAQALREEKKAEEEETTARRREGQAEALLRADPPPTRAALSDAFGLDGLRRAAERTGPRAEAARRVLESVFSHTSYYLANAFLAAGDLPRAILVLEIANDIRPRAPVVEYNLACALARAGDRRGAVAALQRAVEEGFTEGARIATDPDLQSLRREPAVQELLKKLGAAP